jgi:hypothetical protein
MIKILQKLTCYYFPICYLTLYSFFINLSYKKDPYLIHNKVELNTSLLSYSRIEIKSKEIKVLLDLTYRNKMNFYPLPTNLLLCTVDLEGKIIGHKFTYDEKYSSNAINTTINFNKKLLQSTLFGSIKLIKI